MTTTRIEFAPGHEEAPVEQTAEPAQSYAEWCGEIDDEATLIRAVSVMNDVLTDIADWEDKTLAEAVEHNRDALQSMIDIIRLRGGESPGAARQHERGENAPPNRKNFDNWSEWHGRPTAPSRGDAPAAKDVAAKLLKMKAAEQMYEALRKTKTCQLTTEVRELVNAAIDAAEGRTHQESA